MFDVVAATVTGPTATAFWENFLTILLLVFGLFLILAGLFTAYFGSGKSRMIGVSLLIVGLVVGILIAFLYHSVWGGTGSGHTQAFLFGLIWEAFIVILAAVIGALIAVAIFLVAIMKS
jgi:hypothetical protein